MKLSLDQLAAQLESTLGSDSVTVAASTVSSYPSMDGKQSRLLCRPESAEHIAAALRVCTEAEAAVIPWGGGTAMAIGNLLRQTDVIIETSKLDQLIEHDHANLTATLQSGITLSGLHAALAREQQFAPLDAPFPGRSTVGGIVAANLNGPRRSYYGSVRDLVIGMKVALVDGERIKAGGKVVKNVAGYDMCKLFVGSLGTLGIITEVTLRMAPIAESAAAVISSGTLNEAERFNEELSRSPLLPAAVVLEKDGASETWRLAVWCEGFEETVARHLHDLKAIATSTGMNADALPAEERSAFWRRLCDFPLQPDLMVYRVTLPRAKIFEFVALVRNWSGWPLVGDIAAGTVWLASTPSPSAMEQFPRLIEAARQWHGHTVLFAAPDTFKREIDVWGPAPVTLSLQREIKRQFDAKGLLNPGRFPAGI